MTLERGTRLGPYQIESPLGAGGMGEVYKATDTRLERTVAIKVLPAHVASDPERKQRFEREAKVISGLNHPHICTLYEFDNHEGTDFLVMEYLEGETLADRLQKGALPLDQALRYAIEIADALDKAHRQGVTHRDLKPANIMLTKAGAKLLDFGLAKLKPTGPQSEVSTKLADSLTEQGTILGTFQYMAPEQLEGKDADNRTDIWAFGCVVYEMVTGRKAFEGKSQASLISAIMKDDPRSMASLQPMSPPMLDQVIRICLAKDPDERWQSAGDTGRQLKLATDGSVTQVAVAVPTTVAARPAGWRSPLPLAGGALLLGSLITGLAVWTLTRPSPPRLARFTLTTPAAAPLANSPTAADIAVSGDGSRVVYVAQVAGDRQLYVRAVDQLEAFRLRGAEQGIGPFISPDGNWVGYFDPGDGSLKKVSIHGGPPVTLSAIQGILGGSWGQDDTIIYSEAAVGGLFQMSAAGGDPESLTTLDEGEVTHLWPEILPGGEAVLFTVMRGSGSANLEIALLRLDTGERTLLVPGGSNPRYSPTGHIIYGVDGTLRAVPFDLDQLTVTGDPLPVVEGVRTKGSGAATFGVAADGSLVYVSGVGGTAGRTTLVWVDRQGQEEPLAAEPRAYNYPRISPDGTKVALDVRDQGEDIWIWDTLRATLTRLTFDPTMDRHPAWTPDGQRVVFQSGRGAAPNLFWKAADGTGTVERLTESLNSHNSPAFSPDGSQLVFNEVSTSTGFDIHVLSMDGERSSEPLLATDALERNAVLSADGQWMAYQSDASGQFEIYVRPFPNVDDGRWQISSGGGTQPVWGPDGRELFYRTTPRPREPFSTVGGGGVAVVAVQTDPTFTPGNPTVLFVGPYRGGRAGRTYDISPDGQRFLMIKEGAQADDSAAPAQIVLVENWFQELERLVPTP